MIRLFQRILMTLGLHLGAARTYQSFLAEANWRDRERRLAILLLATRGDYSDFRTYSEELKGQLFQDYIALLLSRLGRNVKGQSTENSKVTGWFVEVGAADGLENSNTHFLEHRHGWEGILIEPNPISFEQLQVNRPTAKLERRAVGLSADERHFVLAGQFSTFKGFEDSDLHSERRKGKKVTKVRTATLTEMLNDASAPSYIDLLSVDTEGSELEVLASLDWDSFEFGFIAIEHNFKNGYVENICKVLGDRGYVRIAPNFSEFDVWFTNSRIFEVVSKRFPGLVSL